MNKTKLKVVRIGLFFIFLACIIVVLWVNEGHPTLSGIHVSPVIGHVSASDANYRQTIASEREAFYTLIGAMFSFITGVGAIGVAWIAFRSSRIQWSDSHKQSQQQLRAYIAVKEIGVENINELNVLIFGAKNALKSNPPKHVVYHAKLQNFGATRADEVLGYLAYSILEKRLPKGSTFGSPPVGFPSKSIVSASDNTTKQMSISKEIAKENLEALKSGDKVIYVFGKICYRDIFKNRWVLHFRFFQEKDPFASAMRDQLISAEEGNYEEPYDVKSPPFSFPVE